MNKKKAIGAVAAVVVIAGVVVLALKLKGPPDKGGQDLVVELRPKPGEPDSIVSPEYGREMFDDNCTSCHGWRGEGDGPADHYLWRRPRNLSDGAYMNGRTDAQLLDVIGKGGRDSKSQLSRIMPSWSTTFNVYQQMDLVAWVRRLHPVVTDFVNAGDYTSHEAVLSPARLETVKAKSGTEPVAGDATVTVFAVWSDKKGRPLRVDEPAPAPGTAGLAGYVAFTRVEIPGGKRISLGVAISPGEKKIHKSAVFERVVIVKGGTRDEASVDAYVKSFEGAGENIADVNPPAIAGQEELSKALSGSVKRLYWRILAGIEQDREDWDDIRANRVPHPKHAGREIYERMKCAECHGPAGNTKGPGVAAKEFVAGNLADGNRMREITDQYILDLLENGGPAMNISGTMPSYATQMSKDEMKTLVEYIRLLATEKK